MDGACSRPPFFSTTLFQHSACHSASCNFPRSWPQPCRSMCFGFSMVMAKVGTRGSDQQGRDMLSLIPGL